MLTGVSSIAGAGIIIYAIAAASSVVASDAIAIVDVCFAVVASEPAIAVAAVAVDAIGARTVS